MSRAAKSLFYFGIWMTILGSALIAIPNRLLVLFGAPPTQEGWVRIVGTLTVLIAYCCIQSGRSETREFFHWSVPVRYWVVCCFSFYVYMDMAPAAILIVATIDFVCATVTLVALRLDAATRTAGRMEDQGWGLGRLFDL